MAALKNTHGFTKEQIADFKVQFDSFDEDAGGTISTGELKNVLEKCGVQISPVQVKEMISEFDTDGDGELSFQEFITMMFRLTSGPTEKDIRKVMFEVRAQKQPCTPPPPPFSCAPAPRCSTRTLTGSSASRSSSRAGARRPRRRTVRSRSPPRMPCVL
jgi:hypothetical protein